MEWHALVLAAGAGRRFGGRKLLAPWRSGILLDGALEAALEAPVAGVTLVTGSDAEEIASAARTFVAHHAPEAVLRVVNALDHREGIAASLRAGLAMLPETASGAFIFLGDMPCVPTSMAAALAQALSSREAAAPLCRGRRGHPVLVTRSLFPRIIALRGDTGARTILDQLGPGLALVPTDDRGVLVDVDRASDLSEASHRERSAQGACPP